ncbi:MAG: iron-sulfur cluster assembly accessory protein [Pelagibacteraceae bacterium TMED216]|nr:MAG: iron-sulfur cluster assembly accessory protein [Pelagibacteraceae bacterium TMED216]|tara:strand:- start:2436 stop:2753 length:318 start_codon:yes stop_codon:yes gene_type:complete
MTKNINFTNEALKQIEKIILENKPEKFFRITVQGGGCSGFKYDFSFDKEIKKDDIVFNKTVIDKQSLEIIQGSTIDYNKEMIGNSFVIKNPKAASSCGCGMSFSI